MRVNTILLLVYILVSLTDIRKNNKRVRSIDLGKSMRVSDPFSIYGRSLLHKIKAGIIFLFLHHLESILNNSGNHQGKN
jgi:hypothetical protein